MESAWPRTMAASRRVILRARSGSRAWPGDRPGRSAANVTSSSGAFAIARRHAVTARLNGSVGASFDPVRNLVLDVVIAASPRVVPAARVVPASCAIAHGAGTHNHRRSLFFRTLAPSLYRVSSAYGSRLSPGRR